MDRSQPGRTIAEILGLDQGDSPDAVVLRAYLKVARSDEKLSDCTPFEKACWFLYPMQERVSNGGIAEYFHSFPAEAIAETLEALRAIGAQKTYTCLKRAYDLIAVGGLSDDEETRRRQVEAVTGEPGTSGFKDLGQFVGGGWDDDLYELLVAFRDRTDGS